MVILFRVQFFMEYKIQQIISLHFIQRPKWVTWNFARWQGKMYLSDEFLLQYKKQENLGWQ